MRKDLEEAAEAAHEENPTNSHSILELLSKSEIVALPSEGRYYSNALLKTGQIEIKLMTTVHEDILANQSYVKDGSVIERLVKSLIIDRSIDCDDLLSGDYTAILNAARVSAYGPEYKAVITCPACSHKEEVIVSLENAEPYFETKSILGKAHVDEVGKIHAQLRIQDHDINFVMQMMTMKFEKKLIQRKTEAAKMVSRKVKIGSTFGLVEEMSMVVESINGETDRADIKKFVSMMPAQSSKDLRRLYKEMQPKITNRLECECKVCQYPIQEEVGINPDFFWPKE